MSNYKRPSPDLRSTDRRDRLLLDTKLSSLMPSITKLAGAKSG